MALTEIACPHCTHRGYIPTQSLGRVLRCAACGRARFVRRGKQLVCARDEDDDTGNDIPGNDIPAGIDDAARWAAYEGTAAPPEPPPKRQPRVKKRRLTPRVSEAATS